MSSYQLIRKASGLSEKPRKLLNAVIAIAGGLNRKSWFFILSQVKSKLYGLLVNLFILTFISLMPFSVVFFVPND